LKRELSTLEDQSKKHEIRQRIHNAEVDVNYAMYYPLMKPYSSLYPRLKREEGVTEEPAGGEQSSLKREGQVEGPKGDTDMWKTVERAMKEGTLDALRNRTTIGRQRRSSRSRMRKRHRGSRILQRRSRIAQSLYDNMMITTATEDSSNDIRHGDCLRPFEIATVFDTPGAADYGLASKKLSLLGTISFKPTEQISNTSPIYADVRS
jgi:hypothetical protein